MASHQATKRDSQQPQETPSQEPIVLKLAQQFEKLGKESDEGARDVPDVEDLGKYRQQAQQNSVEAIRGAEERYQQAKDTTSGGQGNSGETGYSVKERAGELTGREGGEAKNAALGELLKDAKLPGEQGLGGGKKDSDEGAREVPDVDDLGKYRQQAQQNSVEAIRGAEERYQQAKDTASGDQGNSGATGYSVKERAGELTGREGGEAKNAALGELLRDAKLPGEQGLGGGKKDYADESTGHFVKDRASEFTGRQGGEETAGEGERETTEENVDAPAPAGEETGHSEGQKGTGYTTAAKNTIATVGKTVIDYTKHAAELAKNVAANTGVGVKDTALNVGKTTAGTTAGIGKSAAGYAGTKVIQAKDVVVVTGLRAAHYTLQKAAQVTKGTADVDHKAAEYTGEKTEEVNQEKAQKGQEAQEHAAKTKAQVQESKPSQVKEEPMFDEYNKEEAEQTRPEEVKQEKAQKGQEAQEQAQVHESKPSQEEPMFDEYKEEAEQKGQEHAAKTEAEVQESKPSQVKEEPIFDEYNNEEAERTRPEEVKQEKAQKGQEAQEQAQVQESKPSQVKEEPMFDEYNKEEAEQTHPEEEPQTRTQGSSFMGAVGEAFSEIAQTTKKMVMVKDSDQKE